MTKNIVSIWHSVKNISNYNYNEKSSLRDFDICIFWTWWINKNCDAEHRIKEIKDFLWTWKNIFVIVNSLRQNFHALIENFWPCKFIESQGWKIKTINKSLWIPDEISRWYTWYFDNITEETCDILYTTNDGKTLWFSKKIWNGNIIIIPKLIISNQYYPSKTEELNKEFVKMIVDFDKSLSFNHDNEEHIPEWIMEDDRLKTNKLLEIECNLKKSHEEMTKQIQLIEIYNHNIQDESKMFSLLFWTWKQLEFAVTKWLELLWYKVSNYDDWELEIDQVIETPEWKIFIWECKWKEWLVDIKDFRQLYESKDRFHELESVIEVPWWILFWNTERLKPLLKRWIESFTKKALASAKASKIILIRTPDLFFAVKYIIDNPENEEFKEKCRQAIETSQWKIVEFPEPTK